MSENYVNRVVDQESNIYGIQDYRLPIPEEQDENKVVSVYEGQYALRELDMSNYYNKSETDTLLNEKADAANVYTKDEVYNKDEVYIKSDVYTKSAVDALLLDKVDVIALDDYYTKKDTDILLDDRGLIVCNSDEEMSELCDLPETFGKYIKFTDYESDKYESGMIYSVEVNPSQSIPDADHPNNIWSVKNTTFDDDRQSLQGNYSTELPVEVLGRGRIDIEQTIALTSSGSGQEWTFGTEELSNPRVANIGHGITGSTIVHKTIDPETKDLGQLISHSTWAIESLNTNIAKNLTEDLDYKPSGNNGIILGTVINRDACSEPSDRDSLTFNELPSKMYGIHTLKVDPRELLTQVRLGVQLFGYIRCHNGDIASALRWWSDGVIDHNIFGSIWLRYTSIGGGEKTIKVSGSEQHLNLASESTDKMIIGKRVTTPQNSTIIPPSRGEQTEGYGYTVNSVCEFNLPQDIATIDGYKSVEIIGVLEAYKEQDASVTVNVVNDVELLAWAAFSDLQVMTAAPFKSYKVFAKNREDSDNVYLANTFDEGYTNRFSVSASDLPSIRLLNNSVLLNVVIQNLKLNSDSDKIVDWRGLATKDGISGIAYTEAGNREDIIVRILPYERVELTIRNESGELETIDEDQSIKVRRLI